MPQIDSDVFKQAFDEALQRASKEPRREDQIGELLVKSDAFWRRFWSELRARVLRTFWGIVAGLALLVGLVGGVLRIWDFFFGVAPPAP